MTNPDAAASRRPLNLFLLVTFILLAIGITAAGFAYQSLQKRHLREAALAEVAAIADLKVRELATWREEQQVAAQVIARDPFAARAVRDWFADPRRSDLQWQIGLWLQKFRADYRYRSVTLLDLKGKVRFSVPAGLAIDPRDVERILATPRGVDATFTTFHRTVPGEISLDLFSHIPDPDTPDRSTGFLLIEIDPSRYLYPYIQLWPTPSATAETLLVERRGDEVVYLNELRHRSQSSLALRLPLRDRNLPAARAARGEEGTMEGADYRGVPVLAAYRKVPGSPWALVSKVDAKEVYASLRQSTLLVGGVVAALVLTAGLVTLNMARRHDLRTLQERDRAREELLESERRAAEAAREREEHFRLLAEALPHLVWVAGADGGITYLNPRWNDYIGEEVEPRQFVLDAHIHPEDRATAVASWKRSVETGAPYEVDYRLRRHDGEYHWFIARGVPVCHEDGRISQWFGTCTDIQDQKRAQEAAAEAARAKTDFMANMSHEIRTPMNGILGITDLLLETKLDALQRQYLDMVKGSGEALLSVVNDVLDFSKLEAGALHLDRSEFNLREMVEKGVRNLSILAFQKGVELTVSVDTDLPAFFHGDAAKLRQVLLNLVANGVKFTEKGEVSVHISGRALQGERWEISFCVADTGIGIPQDKLAMIFDSFTQVDTTISRTYGGTGLGLAIAKRIVAGMGGRIWARSEIGAGSTFFFSVELERVEKPEHEPVRPPADVAGMRALVLDDNNTNRLMLERTLTAAGLQVDLAATGGEAIRKALEDAESTHPYDLILIDLHLPDMDGFQVAKRIRERFPMNRVGIMMITSDDVVGGVSRARELGMAAYLVKPIRTAALHRALKRLHDGPGKMVVIRNEEPAERPDSQVPPMCTRVLLAEDNPVNLTVTETILRNAGVRVTPATNGVEAVEAFDRGVFHLVLMDVQMPHMDGLEATRLIREKDATVPVIALTAHALEGDRDRCIAAGMDDYIPKPVPAAALVEKVGYWARRHQLRAAEPEKLLQQFGGQREDLDLVVMTFLESTPPLLEEVRTAAGAADAQRLAKAAHRLKGSLSVMAAETARCLAEELEGAAKGDDLVRVEGILSQLEGEMTRVLEELQGSVTASAVA